MLESLSLVLERGEQAGWGLTAHRRGRKALGRCHGGGLLYPGDSFWQSGGLGRENDEQRPGET